MRSVMPLASAAAALVASTSWAEGTSKEIMPKGVVIRASDEGLALSLRGGAPLYTLTLDQITENHRSKSGPVLAARCGETCARLWLAIAPPPKFSGTGDWGVRRTGTGVQLTYKGAGLYRFNGKSLDELAEYRIVPPYLTGYSAKVVSVVDGVPRETVYWHRALYQPPPPALRAPGGVQAVWSSDRFILADSAGGVLIVPASSNDCKMPCHEATPLAAPLAAEAIGEWRPKDTEGGRFWTYKGQLVYRSSLATEQKPNRLWRKIVVN